MRRGGGGVRGLAGGYNVDLGNTHESDVNCLVDVPVSIPLPCLCETCVFAVSRLIFTRTSYVTTIFLQS